MGLFQYPPGASYRIEYGLIGTNFGVPPRNVLSKLPSYEERIGPMPPVQTSEHQELSNLLGEPAAHFIQDIWPSRSAVFRGDPNRLDWLLDSIPRDLEKLIQHRRLRLRSWWINRSGRFQQSTLNPQNLPLLRPDSTVVVDGLEEGFPALGRFIDQLRPSIPTPLKHASASFYMGRAQTETRVHYDHQEVLIHQIEGRKRWLYAPCEDVVWPDRPHFGPGALRGPEGVQFPQDLSTFHEVILEPGDALFLPRGWWHQSLALTDSHSITWTLWALNKAEQIVAALHQRLRSIEAARALAVPGDQFSWDEVWPLIQEALPKQEGEQ